MSARQRKKLALAQAAEIEVANESSSDESDVSNYKGMGFSFTDMASSSSDSDSDNEDTTHSIDGHESASVQQPTLSARASKKKQLEALAAKEAQEIEDAAAHEAMREREELDLMDNLLKEVSSYKDSPEEVRQRISQAMFSMDHSHLGTVLNGDVSSVKSIIDMTAISGANSAGVMLDIDTLINRRFAAAAEFAKQMGNGNNKDSKGSKKGNTGRGAMFGTKDEWGRPPSFAAGGLGMRREQQHSLKGNRGLYCFQHSMEYAKQQRVYRAVANTGDVNRLIMYLIHIDSYNVECLLQLSGVFAKLSGGMERALDMVRRALLAFEASAMEGFLSSLRTGTVPLPISVASSGHIVHDSQHEAECLLDWRVPENTPFFISLFRYMQIAGMMGYNGLAADTSRMILALSPKEDPMNVLLCIDYYLLQAARSTKPGILYECRQLLHHIFGLKDMKIVRNTACSSSPWRVKLVFGSQNECLSLETETYESVTGEEKAQLYVSHLGNWWYSLAFMELMWEKQQQQQQTNTESTNITTKHYQGKGNVLGDSSKEDAEDEAPCDIPVSELLLAEAVYAWPYMIPTLLTYLNPCPGVSDLDARVQQSSLFTDGKGTGTSCTSKEKNDKNTSKFDNSGILNHLAEIYAMRNAEICNQDEHRQVLQSAVQHAIDYHASFVINHETEDVADTVIHTHINYVHYDYKSLQCHPALLKYQYASIDDYRDRFPHIPDDANPIEAQLMDPMMLEDEQLQRQRQHFRREGVDLSRILGVDVQSAQEGKTATLTKRFQRALRDRGTGLHGNTDNIIQALAGLDLQLLMQEHSELWGEDNGLNAEDDFIDRIVRRILPAAIAPVQNDDDVSERVPPPAAAALGEVAQSDEGLVCRKHILDVVRPVDAGYTLDMEAPLLQLFLQSIMPWFRWNH